MWASSANPYISKLIFFSFTMHYTFQRLFLHLYVYVSLSFWLITIESSVANQMSQSSLLLYKVNHSQLNKQTATAEKEKLYTLSNIIYIQF